MLVLVQCQLSLPLGGLPDCLPAEGVIRQLQQHCDKIRLHLDAQLGTRMGILGCEVRVALLPAGSDLACQSRHPVAAFVPEWLGRFKVSGNTSTLDISATYPNRLDFTSPTWLYPRQSPSFNEISGYSTLGCLPEIIHGYVVYSALFILTSCFA